jgi:hypothetical protein
LQDLRQHNDIVACQIVDALELQPPAAGRYAISDGIHTGLLDTRSSARRAAYSEYFANHHLAVRDLMRQCAVHLHHIATTDDVARTLRHGLAHPGIDASPGAAA